MIFSTAKILQGDFDEWEADGRHPCETRNGISYTKNRYFQCYLNISCCQKYLIMNFSVCASILHHPINKPEQYFSLWNYLYRLR